MLKTGNLYEIMGLPRYASLGEVKAAFRRLAVQFHPDKNPGNAEAEELFKQISAAYDILGDEQKKREYDLRLSGFFAYQKTEGETEEKKQQKKKEQGEAILKRKREKYERESREIREAYMRAQKVMPYKWRYRLVIAGILLSMYIIITNWYSYDVLGEREPAFFKMFFGYVVTLVCTVYFLNALFKKWNAQNLDKPFRFEVRNRIALLFLGCVGLIFLFSFNAPQVYKQVQLDVYGKTTIGTLSAAMESNIILEYYVDGESISKSYDIPYKYYGRSINVKVKYSTANPHVCEIIETLDE